MLACRVELKSTLNKAASFSQILLADGKAILMVLPARAGARRNL